MQSRIYKSFVGRLLLAGAATILLLGSVLLLYHKRAVAKPPSAFVGTWVGVSDGDVFTYCLELDGDGTGRFGFQFTNDHPDLYRISAWRLTGRTLAFAIEVTPSSSELISLDGSVVGTRIRLRVAGHDWKHRVELWNEEKVLPRILSLKSAMGTIQQATNPADIHQ
jgi:hypothetical protein